MKLKHNFITTIVALGICLLLTSCGDEPKPKPEAFLRLDYNMGDYATYNNNCPYIFDYNTLAAVKDKGNCNFTIQYPKMKATIFLTYKPVNNNINLLLRDAEKLTYDHVIKADDISSQPFLNPANKVYGMFSQVGGDAATNAQFYVTDSTRHFLTGSMYFYAKPNFDSVMPAAAYIKEDMRTIMESLRWK
ncbi:gliding motility lipoprotein GldD [Flavobacterium sp. RHBU_24]|uniref:gliding motility lipoprotein GldD n=1 Tax=Flavobacterium sp. RHBU_24 TaxID=3391185 RepID=UPI00398497C9